MDLSPPSEADAFRDRVRSFLGEHLAADWTGIGALSDVDAAEFTSRWRVLLSENGLLAPAWPKEYGGSGLTPYEQIILAEEFVRAGVPMRAPIDGVSIAMFGNTVLDHGTEDQRRNLLPRIISGEDRWCQGYSEPGAGSDLAAVATRATVDGDEWVIDGQKIWTSYVADATHIFVLTRTEPGSGRHRGLSMLLVPMDQPGVEFRPIRNMNGDGEFGEVFFTGARCPVDAVLGPVGDGWRVAMALLGYERGETAAVMPVLFASELSRLMALARDRGLDRAPEFAVRIADASAELAAMESLALEDVSRFVAGAQPGAEAAVFKLYWSEYHQRLTELALDLLGEEGLVLDGRPASHWTIFQTDDPGASGTSSRTWVDSALRARSGTIYAGTSEIQRSIIAERILGLPR